MRFSKCEFLDNLRIFALVCKGKFYLALFYFSFDPRSHMDILQSIFSTKGWKNKLETSAHVTLFKPWTQHICVFVHSEKTKMREMCEIGIWLISLDFLLLVALKALFKCKGEIAYTSTKKFLVQFSDAVFAGLMLT